jgi:hypothetical protein
MVKGVIYVMTTAVSGLIKIGRTQTKQFPERMRYLENNGYYNVVGLKRAFAIEVDDYDSKEALIHEVFAKHRVADSELFALDIDLVEQLLLAFDGKVIFPENINKEQRFDTIERIRTESNLFSFYRRGIKNGDIITFRYDETITATVIGEREVRYLGYEYKLSPLTRKIMEELGRGNKSGAYQGSQYWCFEGTKLSDIPNA